MVVLVVSVTVVVVDLVVVEPVWVVELLVDVVSGTPAGTADGELMSWRT